jgi:hypothetical protein
MQADVLCGVGEQGQEARPLDGDGQAALMARAGAGAPAGIHLTRVGDEALEEVDILVIDVINLVNAKLAEAAALIAAPSAGPAIGTTAAALSALWRRALGLTQGFGLVII